MGDPITTGAAVGAGLSMMQGGNFKDTLKGAALGGLGGGGYGALTGKGMAGNLLSQGGLINSVPAGFANPEMISPFTPQGIAGTQAMNPSLTGAASTGFLDSMTGKIGDFAKENPMVTQTAANVALQNMMQPTRQTQLPQNQQSLASQSQFDPKSYVPSGLMSQIRIPQYQY